MLTWSRNSLLLSLLPLALFAVLDPHLMLSRLYQLAEPLRPAQATYPSEKARNMSSTTIPSYVHTGPEDSWHGKINSDPENPFQPEKDRYHLYIGYFCPFAHRANLVRELKGLADFMDISVVKPYVQREDNNLPPRHSFPHLLKPARCSDNIYQVSQG